MDIALVDCQRGSVSGGHFNMTLESEQRIAVPRRFFEPVVVIDDHATGRAIGYARHIGMIVQGNLLARFELQHRNHELALVMHGADLRKIRAAAGQAGQNRPPCS